MYKTTAKAESATMRRLATARETLSLSGTLSNDFKESIDLIKEAELLSIVKDRHI